MPKSIEVPSKEQGSDGKLKNLESKHPGITKTPDCFTLVSFQIFFFESSCDWARCRH